MSNRIYVSYPEVNGQVEWGAEDEAAAREGAAMDTHNAYTKRELLTRSQSKRMGAERGARGAAARKGLVSVAV